MINLLVKGSKSLLVLDHDARAYAFFLLITIGGETRARATILFPKNKTSDKPLRAQHIPYTRPGKGNFLSVNNERDPVYSKCCAGVILLLSLT
jgi:hypothetical protein